MDSSAECYYMLFMISILLQEFNTHTTKYFLLFFSCGCSPGSHHHPDHRSVGCRGFPQLQTNRIFHPLHAQTTQVFLAHHGLSMTTIPKLDSEFRSKFRLDHFVFVQPQQPGEVRRHGKRGDVSLR